MNSDDLINEKLADLNPCAKPTGDQLMEAPVTVKLIWKKLPSSLRSRVSVDSLRDFLSALIDSELSARDAGHEVGIPVSVATDLWQAIEKIGLV
jgi:hypothetical protein